MMDDLPRYDWAVRVPKDFRVTIPSAARAIMGLQPGDYIILHVILVKKHE